MVKCPLAGGADFEDRRRLFFFDLTIGSRCNKQSGHQGYFLSSHWRSTHQRLFCSVQFVQPVFHVAEGAEQTETGLGQIESGVQRLYIFLALVNAG